MAILTWQNVPVGDLSAAQDGYRTASMLLDRATNAGQQGIANYQSILDSQKAYEQQMADKAVAAKMMSIQDPEEYKKALAAGLVDPSIAQAASTGAMMQANKQMDVLQGRAQADQQLLNSKQAFDSLAYRMGREQEGDKLSDAAMPVLNEALKIAVNDRPRALALIEQSPMHLEDKAKAVAMIDAQYQDKSNQWRLAMEQRQLNMISTAEQVRQVLANKASGNAALQGKLLTDFANNVDNPDLAAFKKLDPQSRALVSRMVRGGLNQEDPEFFKSVGALNATGGSDYVDSPSNPNSRAIQLLDQAVKNPNLSLGAKIKAAAQPYAMSTPREMAEMIKKNNPNFNEDAFTNAIVTARSKLPKGVQINEGELAYMLMNSLDQSGPLSFDNFGKDKNLDDSVMKKLMDTINTSRIEINEYHQALKVQAAVTKYSEERSGIVQQLNDAARRESQGKKGDDLVKKLNDRLKDLDSKIEDKTSSFLMAEARASKRKEIEKQEADKKKKREEEEEEVRKEEEAKQRRIREQLKKFAER